MLQVAIFMAWGVFQGRALAESENPWDGTFYESIATVQTEHLDVPSDGYRLALSIPYTRVDIAIDNGIALVRVVQVYHNHSSTNQGYAFNMPINAKTALTEFNLWDRGTRYAGAIEERLQAEKVYKEVTGDEAPTMNTDPGLVRRTQNTYQTRVFPIFPEEDKQVELVSCALSEMHDGKVTFQFDVTALVKSSDPRHASLVSRNTDVSIFIRDHAGVEDLELQGIEGSFAPLEDGQVLRAKLDASKSRSQMPISVTYHVASPESVRVHPFTFTNGDSSFFLLRVLARASDLQPVAPPKQHANPFYIGVWHSDAVVEGVDELDFFRALTWEMGAFEVLQMMDVRSGYHGSWRPARMEDGPMSAMDNPDFPGAVVSDELKMQTDLQSVLGSPAILMQSKENTAETNVAVDVVEHLQRCVTEEGCDTAILFLKELDDATWKRLAAVIRDSEEVNFVLITSAASLPEKLSSLSNVAHFGSDQWQTVRAFLDERHVNFLNGYSVSLFSMLMELSQSSIDDFVDVSSLYARLPRLLGVPQSYQEHGNTGIADVYADGLEQIKAQNTGMSRNRSSSDETEQKENPLQVVWISGTMQNPGNLDLSITDYTTAEAMRFMQHVDESQSSTQHLCRLFIQTSLPAPSTQNRFVATMWAQPKAERLASRLRQLRRITEGAARGIPSDWEGDTPAEKRKNARAEMEQVKSELVALSREYSFICSETAFIALPPALRDEYGIMEQEISREEMFNLKSATKGGVPEPHEYLLFMLGALITWYAIRRNMAKTQHASS
jgi:hypothetical protein